MRDKLDAQILELKRTFWGEKKIILHSRDIRKCQNGFEILFDLNVKEQFYTKVNEILGQKEYIPSSAAQYLKNHTYVNMVNLTTYMHNLFPS